MRLERAAALIFAAATLSACATTDISPARRLEADARRELRDMQSAYENNQIEDFLANFSRRDFPDFENFQEQVRQFLIHNHQVTMDIIVDTVVSEADEVDLKAHWNRSFVDETGARRLQEGRAEFLFKAQPAGGLALQALYGDSPF